MGWGIRSYIVAVVIRAISGTITIYILVPWKPSISFSFGTVKELLRFGVPYQTNSLLAAFKDKISLLILGKIIGLEGMGILGWAEKWANLPLRYVLDATVKVAFPLFSRLQDNIEKAKKNLERAVYFIAVLVFPMLAGEYLAMPYILDIIPKYSKWQPGLETLNLFLISAVVASISTFLTNFLTGMGKVKYVLLMMVMWTAITLSLYPYLALKFGYIGVAYGSLVIAATSFVPLILVKRITSFGLLRQVTPAILSSLIMIGVIKLLQSPLNFIPEKLPGFITITVLGIALYLGSLYTIDGRNLKAQINKFLHHARR
jgi:PST family polysaccharide transporter